MNCPDCDKKMREDVSDVTYSDFLFTRDIKTVVLKNNKVYVCDACQEEMESITNLIGLRELLEKHAGKEQVEVEYRKDWEVLTS